MKTKWVCLVCRQVTEAGKPEEFGDERFYTCRCHPRGWSVGQAMANVRRRKANDRSFATRGYGTKIYLHALAAANGQDNAVQSAAEDIVSEIRKEG